MSLLPMAKIALRNLLTKPATRRYPYAVREPFAGSRGRVVIDFPACIFCGACSRRCPAASIAVDKPGRGWRIDRFSCVSCGLCVRVCPKKCLSLAPARPGVALAADSASMVEEHRGEPAAVQPAAPPESPSGGEATSGA